MFDLQPEGRKPAHLEGNILPVINMTFLLLLFLLLSEPFQKA